MRRDVSLSSHQSGRTWLWVLGVLATLAILAIAILPFAMEWVAQKWLREHGHAAANLEDVDFNPFTGKLVLDVLVGGDTEDGQLDAQRIVIDLAWSPLWRRQVLLEVIEVEDAVVEIRVDETGSLSLGRLLLTPLLVADQTREAPAWAFGLQSLALRNVRLVYVQPSVRTDVLIDRADLGEALGWSPQTSTPFTLQLTLGDGEVRFSGEMTPFADDPTLSANLDVDNLPLVWLQDTLEELEERGIEGLEGTVGADLKGTFVYHSETESLEVGAQGKLHIDGIRADNPSFQLRDAALDWDGRIALAGPVAQPAVTASGTLEASDISGLAPAADLEFSQSSLRWQGELELRANSEQPWSLLGDVVADGLDVRRPGAPTPMVAIDTAALTETRLEGGKSLEATRLDLTGAQWTFAEPGQPAYNVTVASLQLPGLRAEVGEDGEVTLSSELLANDWRVGRGPDAAALVQTETLEFQGLRATRSGNLQVEALRASTVQLFEAAESDRQQAPFLMTIGRVNATDLEAVDTSVSLARVGLSDIEANLVIEAEGGSNFRQWLGSSTEEAEETEDDEGAAFTLRVGQVDIEGDNRLAFRDAGVSPAVKVDLGFSASLSDLNTAPDAGPTKIAVQAQLGEFSSLAFDGSAVPMAKLATVQGTGKLSAMPLSRLDPYMRRLTGYRLVTGQLDADLDIDIDAGQLESQASLVLHQLKLEPVDAELVAELHAQLGISLERGLEMLRDKNDDIRLVIPVQGDLKDPDVSFRDAIRQAIRKGTVAAVKTGVLTYFAPLTGVGAVLAVGKLFKFDKGMQLNPVEFAPGQAEMTAEAMRYLDETAALLANRPKVRLQVCGVATSADRDTLAAPGPDPATSTGGATPTSEPAAPTASSAELEEALVQLAQQRAGAVKQYLVTPGGIEPERLFVCSPLIDDAEGATPRVELSL